MRVGDFYPECVGTWIDRTAVDVGRVVQRPILPCGVLAIEQQTVARRIWRFPACVVECAGIVEGDRTVLRLRHQFIAEG